MKLKSNDTIGLIAPSGYIREGQLEQALETVKKLGIEPYYTDRIFEQDSYLAGSDQNRLDDLHHHFENEDVKAIWCIRGGFGATRLLPQINYDLIKNNHKIFMGYSDITALHYAFYKKANLLSFHAPMAGEKLSSHNLEELKNILFEDKKIITHYQDKNKDDNSEYSYNIINKGKAKGKLIGGNLSLITSLIGTEYNLDYQDKIVYIEEIAEPPYKIDRMITQLLIATNLSKASAIILGVFKKCSEKYYSNLSKNECNLHELFIEKFANIKVPIVCGFSFGHIENNTIMPFGVNVKIDTTHKIIKIEK